MPTLSRRLRNLARRAVYAVAGDAGTAAVRRLLLSLGLHPDARPAATTPALVKANLATLEAIRRLAAEGRRQEFDQALWVHCEVIRHYLQSFVIENAGADYIHPYVNDALPRFFRTLALLPLKSGLRTLELGANPYLFSLLVQRFLDYDTRHANFFTPHIYDSTVGHGVQRIESEAYGERYTFAFDTFNLEVTDPPYPAESFDLVFFCEILEHLVINPLAVFPRLHRLLRPGGQLLLTTPNAVRWPNVALMIAGSNFFDRYHPEFGVYGRHNREFTVEELERILGDHGFRLRTVTTLDRYDYTQPTIWKDSYEAPAHVPLTRPQLEGWLRQIGGSLQHRGDNIYILAER